MKKNDLHDVRASVWQAFVLLALMAFVGCSSAPRSGPAPAWPETSHETKPWTRQWWHGSTVDEAGLTVNMEALQQAGFGGIEITPIYGVKGFEQQSIPFLSSRWMEVFAHTLKEGKRLDLGIDLANASGWPFGGPWISGEYACRNVQFRQYALKEGERLSEKVEMIQQPQVCAVG
ncbi:MAG: glycosyl hydrolase, partial [Mangrovibacterium sp.]